MSTNLHERFQKKSKAEPTVPLVSRFRELTVLVDHNDDIYTDRGALRTQSRGRKIKFRGGKADVPESWMEDVKEVSSYNVHFWVLGDPAAKPAGRSGPQVVDGAVSTATHDGPEGGPPLPEWDELGARQLRPMIEAGKVDLDSSLIWEFNHKNRAQIIEALRKAKSIEADQPEEEAPGGDDFPEGFVQPPPQHP